MDKEESVQFAQKYLEDLLSFFGANITVSSTCDEDVIELSYQGTFYDDVKAAAVSGSLFGSVTATNSFSIMPTTGKMLKCNIDKIDAWIKAGTPNN